MSASAARRTFRLCAVGLATAAVTGVLAGSAPPATQSSWLCGTECNASRQVTVAGSTGARATSAIGKALLTATATGGKIVIARGDGGGRRVLGSGDDSFVSPDGSRVAVVDYDFSGPIEQAAKNSRLELFTSAGGPPRHVIRSTCRHIYWSPNSERLACAEVDFTDINQPGRLLLIDAASAASTTLARGYFDPQVSFSPDSTRLAYVRLARPFALQTGRLNLIDLGSRAITTIRTGATAPVWGTRAIAFGTVKPSLNVAVVQPDGSGFRRLTDFHPASFLQGGLVPIAWSADGTRLLGGQGGQDTWRAYAIDPIRGGARRIEPSVTPSALSRDGRFVIGDSTGGEDFGPDRADVVRVPWAPGGKARVLLRNAIAPSFSG